MLNASKSVSEGTREAVQSAVAALGYHPNSIARSLIAKRPRHRESLSRAHPRLIAVGYLSIDYMVRVDRVPSPGERMTSHSIKKMLGGPAANVAAFAAGLGAPFDVNVEIVTHVGDDADSTWALEELSSCGIDVSGTHRQIGGRLSRCMVLVDENGQRTIVNEPLQVPLELVAVHLARDRVEQRRSCVHFDGFHLSTAEGVQESLRGYGHSLSLHSAGLAPEWATREGCRRLMEMFDLLFLDRDSFARIAAGDSRLDERPEAIFEDAAEPRCQAILLTQGADGATLLRPGSEPVREAAPDVPVVDVTGAGDAFTGLFLASWLSHGSLETALPHAVSGASLSLTALGAQGRLPTAAELETRQQVADGA